MGEEVKDTFKVELPSSLTEDMSEKIAQAVRENYYHNAGRAIAEKVKEKLESDGFADRVAEAVVVRMKVDEDEYTEGITAVLKQNLLDTIGLMANKTLEAIQKRIDGYGFIKIGDKW
jgi:uncharacterized protein (DUF2267 family)